MRARPRHGRRAGLFVIFVILAAGGFVPAIADAHTRETKKPEDGSATAAAAKPLTVLHLTPIPRLGSASIDTPTTGTPTVPSGECAVSTPNVADGPDGKGGCWPGPTTTGVPASVNLSAYEGPCTITATNTVIDSKLVDCDLTIRSTGVVIKNSQINGWIYGEEGKGYSFEVTDSFVNASPNGRVAQVTAVGSDNFTVLRSEITGGNRGVYCRSKCTVRDSWVHGIKIKDDWHASAVRMEQDGNIAHNTLVCDADVQPDPEGSCSATLTGYGDFAAVKNNTIEHNLFLATKHAAFCAYGGSSKGKPFSTQTANIVFRDNVFQRGTNKGCSLYGPIGDWDPARPGNVWTNNRYDDGTVIANKAS
jgi:hypothetical protein